MKYLSLFSGIGGFELGIQQAHERSSTKNTEQRIQGARDTEGQPSERPNLGSDRLTCIGFSEIDKYAIATYQQHFPEHKNYGDITKINADELPDFDLLVGGFPCQAFSIAGKRKGFEDTRGTLFFEIARILKAKQPRLFCLENVKGLLSHDNGNTFRTIVSTLNELGYDLQWQVLNSKNHGVPQNRERVFIIGHLRGTSRPEVFPITRDSQPTASIAGYISEEDWPRRHEQIRRVYKTDGAMPTIPTGTGGGVMTKIAVREATKKGYAEATLGDSINLSVPESKTRRGRVGKGVAQTLDTGMQQYTLTNETLVRRLTPTECERLQGFPDGWTIGSDTQRYKQCGNAVTVNVIKDIMERLL